MSFKYAVSGDVLEEELIKSTIPETLWQKIYLHLKKLGYEVYATGQKRDKCQNSYVVIKENGGYAMGDSDINGYRTFDIIIYHPINQYSSMEPYAENIKQAMCNIKELRATGYQTPSIVDDEVQAYTTSFTYQQFKQIRRR